MVDADPSQVPEDPERSDGARLWRQLGTGAVVEAHYECCFGQVRAHAQDYELPPGRYVAPGEPERPRGPGGQGGAGGPGGRKRSTWSSLRWRCACSFRRRYRSPRRRYGLVRHGTGSGAPRTCYARGHLSVRSHGSTLAPLCRPGNDLPGGRASAFWWRQRRPWRG